MQKIRFWTPSETHKSLISSFPKFSSIPNSTAITSGQAGRTLMDVICHADKQEKNT